MEAVIFIGIPASGKTTFYHQRFAQTHIRLSMDMLNTRHRESILLNACFRAKQPLVIDNTNPTRHARQRYIEPAKAHRFSVVGYYFRADVEAARARNAQRPPGQSVPVVAIYSAYKKLELPRYAEGFDKLFYVAVEDGSFRVEDWQDEV